MNRDTADSLVRDCLERAIAGEGKAGLVHEIELHGSYLRGAHNPNDVDLIVYYRSDDEMVTEMVRWSCGSSRRNPEAAIVRAIRGGRNRVHIQLVGGPLQSLEIDGPRMTLWRRGKASTPP